MAAAVMASFGFIDHPHVTELDEAKNPMAAHISPNYHLFVKTKRARGGEDFKEFSQDEHNGMNRHWRRRLERGEGMTPCTWDEFVDVQCRTHPQNRFAGKMTVARPGEYCDAWTLPRLETCRKIFGLEE